MSLLSADPARAKKQKAECKEKRLRSTKPCIFRIRSGRQEAARLEFAQATKKSLYKILQHDPGLIPRLSAMLAMFLQVDAFPNSHKQICAGCSQG